MSTNPKLNSPIATAADLFEETVNALIKRTPSIVAAAANELSDEVVNLYFGDDTSVSLSRKYNGLKVRGPSPHPTVECFFSDSWLRRLYDLEMKPADSLKAGHFDARGSKDSVLAVWRTFQLLSQRAAGLRYIQNLWADYRKIRKLDIVKRDDNRHPLVTGKRYLMPDAAALLRGAEETVAPSASVAANRALWNGKKGQGWWELSGPRDADLAEVLRTCKEAVAKEIQHLIPKREPDATLYELMRDYPDRGGKGLRPTLCIASCGAFGGQFQEAVRIAAALEMFHNAFLIHDDIEDESDYRRGDPCLHTAHGVGLAVNAGDGLNLQALDSVLTNIETLGLARTLALIHEIINMCRETIEGQAMELGWIRHKVVPEEDNAYFTMATKKTGWYTCMSPCRLGATAAGHTRPKELDLLGDVFHKVGISFQIQDDLLNLLGKEELYGKEPLGDLLEGKRTLMLIHLMRTVTKAKRKKLMAWLSQTRLERTVAEAQDVLAWMHEVGSIEYGRKVAAEYALLGTQLFEKNLTFIPENESKAVLRQVADYVNTRDL
ncbi:MAG: polyprenyl synthetase family protein [Proteobacteria bacterium]|nr:polyprenyl synthetase family protein [Pseudomonadota bacterium]